MAVCAEPGCPNIAPCPDHTRPRNAPWSNDRDHKAHLTQRRQLIKQHGPICERCGWTTDRTGKGLHMHHVSQHHVQLLCQPCHRAVDKHAR